MAVHNYNKARLECYAAINDLIATRIQTGKSEIVVDRLYALLSLQYGYSKRFVEECIRVMCMNNSWKVIHRYNDNEDEYILVFGEREGGCE